MQSGLILFISPPHSLRIASNYINGQGKWKTVAGGRRRERMATATATATAAGGCLYYSSLHRRRNGSVKVKAGGQTLKVRGRGLGIIRCKSSDGSESERGVSIQDFIGGDLLKLDLGRWLSDVEEHKALAIYTPHEGGYEGRYATRLRYQGYYFLDISARGLGDPETTLTKVHPVCPAHLGKQPIARWYFPPEVDYRLAALPPTAKGLIVWVIEAKVLSKAELQFLALLPSLRPKVRVIAECGNWRKFMWRPLKEAAGLTTSTDEEGA